MSSLQKRALFIVFIVLVFSQAYGQVRRPQYQLLWKISGKGLTKPSYLFGSMHVRDSRAFDFNDSMFAKMNDCEAFAMEVHPDSIMLAIYEKGVDRYRSKHNIKEAVDPKRYEELNARFKEAMGYGLDDPQAANLTKLYADLTNLGTSYRNDKDEFLDIYLYIVANKMDKKMFGLESMNMQLRMLDTILLDVVKGMAQDGMGIKEKIRTFQDSMITFYHNGDLDKLNILLSDSNNVSAAASERLFNRRNKSMADSISNLVQGRSTFVVIGAGHLAGDNGVVSLLTKKGYTLTPVTADFNNKFEAQIKTIPEKAWTTFNNTNDGYAIDMPGQPTVTNSMYVYTDLSNMMYYFTASKRLEKWRAGTNMDGFMDSLAQGMAKGVKGRAKFSRKLDYKGAKAMDFNLTAGVEGQSLLFKVRCVLTDDAIHMLMIGASPNLVSKLNLNSERFFGSLDFISKQQMKFVPFEDKHAGYKILMPELAKSKILEQPVKEGSKKVTKFTLNTYFNAITSTEIFVRYSEQPMGYLVNSFKVYLNDVVNNFSKVYKAVVVHKEDIVKAGCPGQRISYESKAQRIRMEIYKRKAVMFIVSYARSPEDYDTAEANKYFSSLEFYEPTQSPAQMVKDTLSGITAYMPNNYESMLDTTGGNVYGMYYDTMYKVYGLDTANQQMYTLDDYVMKPYSWMASPDSLLAIQKKKWTTKATNDEDKDSLISEKSYTKNGVIYYESISSVNYPYDCRRMLIALKGRHIYELDIYNPADYMHTSRVDSFFSATQFPDTKENFSLFQDKASDMLRSILDTNTKTRDLARNALYNMKLTKQHSEQLHQTLKLKSVHEDTSGYYSSRGFLFRHLKETDDDEGYEFVKQNFDIIAPTGNDKTYVLSILSAIKKPEVDQYIVEFLEKGTLTGTKGDLIFYATCYNLFEFPSLSTPLLGRLNKVAATNNDFAASYYKALRGAVEKKAYDHMEIESLEPDMFTKLDVNIARIKAQGKDSIGEAAKYRAEQEIRYQLRILANTENKARLHTALQQLASMDVSTDIMYWILSAGIKSGMKTDKEVVNRLALDFTYRKYTYELLAEAAQKDIFPKKYLEPRYWGASEVYDNVLSNQEDSPDLFNIEYVSTHKVTFHGHKGDVYVYMYQTAKDGEWYFAMSGLYEKGSKDPHTAIYLTGTNYKLLANRDQIVPYIKEIMDARDPDQQVKED